MPVRKSILGLLGVYALNDGRDVQSAKNIGVSFTLTDYRKSSEDIPPIRGMAILDKTPQTILYHALCPKGPLSCSSTPSAISVLEQQLDRHLHVAMGDPAVVGYYLVDDGWADFSAALPKIRKTIRDLAPESPTVCGFGLELPAAVMAAKYTGLTAFRNSLVNFSPDWCDYVYIYAYRRASATPQGNDVNWAMTWALPQALSALREVGWEIEKTPLIGGPQAFGYTPRTLPVAQGGLSYVAPPTASQLALQTRAFCSLGARAILAYAWRDPSQGSVVDLSRSASLRHGLTTGFRTCQLDTGSIS